MTNHGNRRFALVAMLLSGSVAIFAQVPQIGSSLPPSAGPSDSGIASKLSSSSSALIAVPEDFSKLKIAPGFLLNLQTFDEPELSGEFRVDEGGNISLPLAGVVHVGDCTLAEARSRIEGKLLSSEVLKRPQVSLNIDQYAPFIVAVMGEVQSPSRVQLLAPHSLLDILSQVGGETGLAGGVIQVRHSTDGQITTDNYPYGRNSNGSSIENVMIHDGDTVMVPQAGVVYVLGAVNRPGGYLMQEDGKLNAAQALSLAQGTSLTAAVSSIRVVRQKPDGTYIEFPVDYKAISEGKRIPLDLQAQDIVYVPVSKLKSVFTSGSSLVGQAAYSTVYASK